METTLLGAAMTPENGVRMAMGVLYAITSAVGLHRFFAFGCRAVSQPNRVFHIILAVFAATRAADMVVGVFVNGNIIRHQPSIFLSRLAICFFFSLCSHVVAQW